MQRIERLELMDSIYLTDSLAEGIARFFEIVNKYFGGYALIIRYLERWSKRWDSRSTITILDVGTGGGDLPVCLALWARKKGVLIHLTGIDIVPELVQIARRKTADFPEIEIKQIDFLDMDSGGRKYDYVISTLLLHHVYSRWGIDFLKSMDKIAARGIIVNDLIRSRLAYWAVGLASVIFGNAIVRHDGPLSVQRALSPVELNDLAGKAGTSYLHVQREPWFRLSLAGEKV